MKSEWIKRELKDLISYTSKGIAPSYTEKLENSVLVLNQKCNRNFELDYSPARRNDLSKKKVPAQRFLERGDVLVNSTGTGTAGRVAQFEGNSVPVTVDGHMIILRPKEEIDRQFFGYLIKANQRIIEKLAEGSTGQTEINRDRLEKLSFRIPAEFAVQHLIGNLLACLDRKIKVNQQINKNLLEQASTLFNSSIQQSSSVVFVELGSLADVKGGKRLPKGTNLVTSPNQHPYIRVRDLNNVVYASLSNDYEYVDDETQKSISRYVVSAGDLIISIVGTIGLTAIVDHTLNKANLTENCVKLTNLKKVTAEYLLLFLRSSQGAEAISRGTVGAVQPKLPIKNIQSIAVPLLCDEELLTLNEKLSAIFSKISTNTVENKLLADIRDTLLPKLMSGKLDVSTLTF